MKAEEKPKYQKVRKRKKPAPKQQRPEPQKPEFWNKFDDNDADAIIQSW
jgi:hypothetical protein